MVTITCCFSQHRATRKDPPAPRKETRVPWRPERPGGRHSCSPQAEMGTRGERSHPAGHPRWAAGDKRQLRPLTGPAEPPATATAARAGGSGRSGGQPLLRLAAARPPSPPLPPSCPESGARPDSARQDLRPVWVPRPFSPRPSPLACSAPRYLGQLPIPERRAGGAGRAGAGGRAAAASAAPARSASRGARFRVRAIFGCVWEERSLPRSRSDRAPRGSHGAVRSRCSPPRRSRSRAEAE